MKTKLPVGAALLGAVILGVIIAGWSSAQNDNDAEAARTPAEKVTTSFSETEESEIRDIVRAYLLDHPEVIIEAVNNYSERKQLEAENLARAGARDHLSALLDANSGFIAGADIANAKVAVIEMFDYHCTYCKRAAGAVKKMTASDKDVKVVFRDLPILRPESDVAAHMALAAREQGKFLDLHFAMMDAKGVLTKKRIEDIAEKLGIDAAKMETASKKESIASAIAENLSVAQEMGVDGTPAFIVAALDGSYLDVMTGYHYETLMQKIEDAKAAANGKVAAAE